MEHILIPEQNLKLTGHDIELDCMYCNKNTPHKIGMMGSLCLVCDLQMFDFDSWHDVYMHIKRKYNLKRRDIAKILNLSPGTVSNYQSIWIWRLVDALLKWHYQQHEVNNG
jgi:hypothetical protein